MPQSRHQNRSKRCPGKPVLNWESAPTGYYMWDIQHEVAYPRNTCKDSVCTAAAANKRSGSRSNFSGVYFDRGKCFIMLDFVDGKFTDISR